MQTDLKISLVRVHSPLNIGDNAITLGTIKYLKKIFPDCLITCHIRYTEKDLKKHEELFSGYIKQGVDSILPSLLPTHVLYPKQNTLSRSKFIYHMFKPLSLYSIFLIARSKTRYVIFNDLMRKAFLTLTSDDIVIMNGGYHFSDDYGGLRGMANAFITFYPLLLARTSHRPVVLLGVSMGPFKGKMSRLIIRKTLNKAKLLVRDNYSKAELIASGISPQQIHIVPDIGFYLYNLNRIKRIPNSSIEEHLKNKFNIGIIVRDFPNVGNKYLKSMANLCDYLIENKEAGILLVPQTTNVAPDDDDDTLVLDRLYALIKHKEKVNIIGYNSSPQYIMELYQHLDLIVSSRFHGLVLSRPTPVIAIPTTKLGYRLEGMMEMLGLSEYVCYLNGSSDLEKAKKLIDKVWEQRDCIRKQQQEVLEDILKKLDALEEELTDFVANVE